jgi:hypothetical protein
MKNGWGGRRGGRRRFKLKVISMLKGATVEEGSIFCVWEGGRGFVINERGGRQKGAKEREGMTRRKQRESAREQVGGEGAGEHSIKESVVRRGIKIGTDVGGNIHTTGKHVQGEASLTEKETREKRGGISFIGRTIIREGITEAVTESKFVKVRKDNLRV